MAKRKWKWSPRRRKAAKLIAKGEFTVEEIAWECGVSDRTIYKWKKEPEFDAYVKELEEAIKAEAKRYLFRHALAAAQRLVELSQSATPKDRVRLQATIEVLNRSGVIAVRGVEVENVGTPIVAILPAVKNEDTVGSA